MSVTVKTADLVGLLTDLAKSTGDKTMPALHAVQLFTDGSRLVGNSTNRFVAAQATAEIVPATEGEPAGSLPVILVPMDSVKLILSMLKAEKRGDSHLSVDGDTLRVDSIAGVTTVRLDAYATFPDLVPHFSWGNRVDIGEVSFNEHVLGVALAVAKRRKMPVRMVFTKQDGHPRSQAYIGDQYRVVLMPIRNTGEVELPAVHSLPKSEAIPAAA